MKILLFIVLSLVILVTVTLLKNDANLFQSPGIIERLQVFLTSNSAQTADDHSFTELITPVFKSPPAVLYERSLQQGINLGWSVGSTDSENMIVKFVVQSVVFGFEDDVVVRVSAIEGEYSSLYIHSSSRIGSADFAANFGHIQALLKGLAK